MLVLFFGCVLLFFFSIRRRHTRCALVTGVQTCALPISLICEEPKVGPHRAAMRARVAGMLQVDPHRVSIKATTTERLGFTGRREGIAAQAIATIRLPDKLE